MECLLEIIAILMLTGPAAVYLVTLRRSGRLAPVLRTIYRLLGGLVVFGGSGISLYFAMYTGEQGGIAAYFFQLGVISAYLVLVVLVIGLHLLTTRQKRRGAN